MECITISSEMHEEGREVRLNASDVQSLYEVVRKVPDQRARRGRRYEAATVVVLMMVAKLAGEESVSGIAQWVRLRQAWLQEVLGLRRLPCANTYSYILEHLEQAELQRQLCAWFAERVEEGSAKEMTHWAVDGKVLRGSQRQMPPSQAGCEVLGVYAVESGHMEHQQTIAGKGYEAATAQAFVAQTDCRGKVITADALHTRPHFCRQIRQQGGHYVLLVKRNRAELEAEIRHLFALPAHPAFPVRRCRTVEVAHGRTAIRQLHASSELNLALAAEWRDVAQVFLLERWVTRKGIPSFESVCGLTSLPAHQASPAQLLAWVQAHWSIENRSHWRRDATLGEDTCTVRHPLVATTLALLNSAILALLDKRKVQNVRSAIRTFAAFPQMALRLLLFPL